MVYTMSNEALTGGIFEATCGVQDWCLLKQETYHLQRQRVSDKMMMVI